MQIRMWIIFFFLVVMPGGLMKSMAAQHGCCCASPSAAIPPADLTEAEKVDLLFMREEEKLARDVYNAMHERYEGRVFVNIPRAEQRHMDAILGLLAAYGLDDPANRKPGKFNSAKLQQLYDTLIARASGSKQDAFLVGALIEEVDIKDLQEALQRTGKEDLRAVYENLIDGSKRHLNAFVRNYESISGKQYLAQHLPQDEVNGMLGR
jgi:hypothetical protein